MTRFVVFTLTVLVYIVTRAHASSCTILNECGRLSEHVYQGTKDSPEIIFYQDSPVRFANGAAFQGKRLSFSLTPGQNPARPYLGVWRLQRGTTLYYRLVNASPTSPANLHLHGMHVKGTGADDPTLHVMPHTDWLYKVVVPRDHSELK